MTITLFVGDNDSAVATTATNYNTTAFLIDYNNYQHFLDSYPTTDITAYTSLSDLPKIVNNQLIFFEILLKADKIFYCPPTKWSDYTPIFTWGSQQRLTEYYLHIVNLQKNNVSNIDLSAYDASSYLKLSKEKNNNDKTLWISGCSVSHGVGVTELEQFGNLIAKQLNLSVIHLTNPGSSIEWAADQILRSNVQSGDIVIWGLTNENRTVRAVNGSIGCETDPNLLLDETRLYHAVTKVYQVVNFCKKISARLILLPILSSENLNLAIHNLEEYQQVSPKFLDKGTDKIHPGPCQHQEWANICINLLKDT